MNSARHLTISLILAFLMMIIGTVGYMMVEGWNLMDALYMTVITVSTVGYSEVRQVDAAGRIFTIFIVITGGGFSLYVAGAVVQFMVEGQIRKIMGRRRLDRKLKRLKNHTRWGRCAWRNGFCGPRSPAFRILRLAPGAKTFLWRSFRLAGIHNLRIISSRIPVSASATISSHRI